MRRASVYPKPWETVSQAKKRKAEERVAGNEAAAKAKRRTATALSKSVKGQLTKDVAMAIAREYVKHGDMRHALVVTGFADEDISASQLGKIASKVRQSARFAEAFDHVVVNFNEHELLTRERVLAGLFIEASDRFGPTSAAARVTAWSKLAQLTGLEADAKRGDDLQKEMQAPGGVLLVPFVSSIEDWEQAAMSQQAQLKADVRN